uniref:Spondin domain-containing protein n=1 Tax=Rhodosorus marinus TaxID=101924 RepID=A0A7S0BRJ8_9RHOD|mmetsp:Transcript_6035/g.8541  ORF Transcript_6035/g.8541 Transcript_6035/m.8541 type:complete len:233 (+) Transcript_6035:84-782(+)
MFTRMMLFIAAVVFAVSAHASPVGLDTVARPGHFPCEGSAIYKIVIKYLWTGATHPDAYPPNGYFSPTVVASHGIGLYVWTPHGYSSKGVEVVAEKGSTDTLLKELEAQKGRNVYDIHYTEERTEDGSEKVKLLLKLDYTRTYASGISMLVPSPDWFTGFDNVNLCDEKKGKWVKSYKQNLSVWDAGTDKGKDFKSPNKNQSPKEPIESILGSRFSSIPVGTVKMILVSKKK